MCSPLDRTPYTRTGSSLSDQRQSPPVRTLSFPFHTSTGAIVSKSCALRRCSTTVPRVIRKSLFFGSVSVVCEAGISQKPQSSLGLPA